MPCVAMLFTRSRFRSLALVTAIATIVLFAIGGLVRGTGSGLGCSTWPACEPGHLFPSGTVHSLIEFSHRTMAFLVAVLTALTGVAAIRVARRGAAAPLAGGPRVPARAGPGGARRRGRRDRARPLVGHRALRDGALLLIADVTYVRERRRRERRRADAGATDAGAIDPFARLARSLTAAVVGTPAPGRHVRAGERRAARVHGLAVDGREARADARRRRHGDVPAPRARRDRDAARALDGDPGADRRRRGASPRPALHDRPRAVRRADHGRRGQRVDAAPAVGGRGARGAVRPDLGHGRRARHRASRLASGTRHRAGARPERGDDDRRAPVAPRHRHRVLPAHEAAHRPAAADHDGAGDAPRRARDSPPRG